MKQLAKIAVGIWFLVFVYFFYSGLTTTPSEGDSLAYHLPIAQNIAKGNIWSFYGYGNPNRLFFYPAMGETLLALFIRIGIPLNLFNLLGWVLLSGIVFGLGRRVGLSRNEAIIMSSAMSLWPSVIRLIPNQTVDIWVAIWFTASLYKLEKVNKTKRDWVFLGLFLGMLIGTKYSGPMFAVVLLLVYSGEWIKKFRESEIMWLILLIVGGFWYVRNLLITGAPFYPGAFLIWKGDETYHLQDWSLLTTLTQKNNGLFLWIQALISEFLIYPMFILLPLFRRNRLVIVGLLSFVGCLFIPSWPQNIISDSRYLYSSFIPLLAAAWIFIKEKGYKELLATVSVLCMSIELTQLDFKPKLFLIPILVFIGLNYKKSK